jgi:hypothetical protein
MKTNSLMVGAFTCMLLVSTAFGQEIYKCKTANGTTIYSDAQCPGVKYAVNVAPSKTDLTKLSDRQANLYYECYDALDYLQLDPKTTSTAIVIQLDTIRIQFDEFCQPLGFKKHSPATVDFNLKHYRSARAILDKTNPNTPIGTRVYNGEGRQPAIFEGY